MKKNLKNGMDSVFEEESKTPPNVEPTPLIIEPTPNPTPEIIEDIEIEPFSIDSILDGMDIEEPQNSSNTEGVDNLDSVKPKDPTGKVDLNGSKADTKKPVDIGEYESMLEAGATMYVETVDLFVSKICGSISKSDSDNYKLSSKEKAEYYNISKVYFKSMKIKINPTTIFMIATGVLVGGNLIKSVIDRQDNIKEEKKLKRIIEKAPENSLIKSEDKDELKERLRATQEYKDGRKHFELLSDSTYKYNARVKTFPRKEQRVKASDEIIELLNQGASVELLRKIMYGNE
jgi:hypothetical protein